MNEFFPTILKVTSCSSPLCTSLYVSTHHIQHGTIDRLLERGISPLFIWIWDRKMSGGLGQNNQWLRISESLKTKKVIQGIPSIARLIDMLQLMTKISIFLDFQIESSKNQILRTRKKYENNWWPRSEFFRVSCWLVPQHLLSTFKFRRLKVSRFRFFVDRES